MQSQIDSTVSLEADIHKKNAQLKERDHQKNVYAQLIHETAEKMKNRVQYPEYALNQAVLSEILSDAKKWLAAKENEMEGAVFREAYEALKKQIEEEMERFHTKYMEELERERIAREEMLRKKRAEEEQKRREEEQRKKEEQEKMVKRWCALEAHVFDLNYHFTDEEYTFLKDHERDVFHLTHLANAESEVHALHPSDPRAAVHAEREPVKIPGKRELFDAMAYRVPLSLPREEAPRVNLPQNSFTQSTVELEPGVLYCGGVNNGVPEGSGTVFDTVAKEVVYRGGFSQGCYHGRGTLYSQNVEVKDGEFERGVFKRGRYIRSDGLILKGDICDNKLCGKGTMILPSGVFIDGQWDMNTPKGKCLVHICESIPDLEYDFSDTDSNTKFSVSVKDDRVFYNDKYLLRGTQYESVVSPVLLFYFNGDVFIGHTTGRNEPVKGDFYHMINGNYAKLLVGDVLQELSIVTLSWTPSGLIQPIDLSIEKSGVWSVCCSCSFRKRCR